MKLLPEVSVKMLNTFLVVVIAGLTLLILNKALSTFNHNEHMYVAAGVMMNEGKSVYTDFAFLQTPLVPIIYAKLFLITGQTHLLTSAKLFTFLLFMISAAGVYSFARFVIRPKVYHYLMVLVYMMNTSVIFVARDTSNYMLGLCLSLLAFVVFVRSIESPKPFVGFVLAGVLASLAVCAKLYYIVILPAFLLTSLVFPLNIKLGQRAKIYSLPLTIGMIAGISPILYYLFTGGDNFIFNNIGFHFLTTEWRAMTNFKHGMTVLSKMEIMRNRFLAFDCASLLLGTFFFSVLTFQRKTFAEAVRSIPAHYFLSATLMIAALLTIPLLTPMYMNYFAMPVSFMILLFISSFSMYLQREPTVKIFLAGLIFFLGIYSLPEIVLVRPHWEGARMRETGLRIKALGQLNPGDTVATLAPIYPLEAGLSIYPELATGSFLYRVGDLMTTDQRRAFIATSPETIVTSLLTAHPPAAIFIGFDGGLDKPFRDFAMENQYRKIEGDFGGGQLFVRNDTER